jgi:hypothetical protein
MFSKLKDIKGANPEVLQSVIKSLQGCPNDSWEPPDDPPTLQPANNIQTKIGWRHIFYGRLAKALTRKLVEDPQKTTTPTASARQLLRIIWDTFLILWQQRNNQVHNETTTTKAERQKTALKARVQNCFDKQFQIKHADRQKLFRKQQEELMEDDPRTIKTWVKIAERIIRTSKKNTADKKDNAN